MKIVKQEFPVEISPQAIQKLIRFLKKDGREGIFIRIGVKGGGCSGFEYVIKIDETLKESDLIFESEDIKVVCDPKSARFLVGASLVLSGNLIGSGVKFENPNVTKSCGCGSSFTPHQDLLSK